MANEGTTANPARGAAAILAALVSLGTSGFAVPDNVFAITGSSDATKIARFEVDGLTTATTRVYTLPNADVVVAGAAAALTSGRVPFATAGGLLTDNANLTWNGTTLAVTGAATISTTLALSQVTGTTLAISSTASNSVTLAGGMTVAGTAALTALTVSGAAQVGVRFGIGGAANTYAVLDMRFASTWGGATFQNAVYAEHTFDSTCTTARSYGSQPTLGAGAAPSVLYHYSVQDAIGSGTVTSQYGVHIEALTKGTNNYAIYSAGAGKWVCSDTTASTTIGTGSFTTLGGVGIAGALNVGSSSIATGVSVTASTTAFLATVSDAGTTNTPSTFVIDHTTSGTPAAGFGHNVFFSAKSSTTATQRIAVFQSTWVDATHATRKGRIAFFASDASNEREGLRIEASGTAPMVGLYGTTAIAQYATTGTATGFTAGAGTTATHLSTFTGNTGSAAYTVGDIVRALKLIGIMAA